jgi:hypothetical protein
MLPIARRNLTVTPQAFMGSTKIISDGKIIAMVAGKTRTHGS